jgi:hypothetical protein
MFWSCSLAQSNEFNLTKGQWNFTVSDSINENGEHRYYQGKYKFKKSGKFKVKKISFIYYGKTYNKAKGTWSLQGNTLNIDREDFAKLKSHPIIFEIIIVSPNKFYSPQLDGPNTFYWIFEKKSS